MGDVVTRVGLLTICAVLLVFRCCYAQETLSSGLADAGNPAYETKKQEALSILKKNEEDPLVQTLIKAVDDPVPGVIAQYITESAIEASAHPFSENYRKDIIISKEEVFLRGLVSILNWKIRDGIRTGKLTENEFNDKFLPVLEQATKHKDADIVSVAWVMAENNFVPNDIRREWVHDILFSDQAMHVKGAALGDIYRVSLSEHNEAKNYVSVLISLLKEEKDLSVVHMIINTLGKMGPVAEPAIPYFINRVNEDPRRLFDTVVWALKGIKTQKAEEALQTIQMYKPKVEPVGPREKFLIFVRTLWMPLISLVLCIYLYARYEAANCSFSVGRLFSALYCFNAIKLILLIISYSMTITHSYSQPRYYHLSYDQLNSYQRLPEYIHIMKNISLILPLSLHLLSLLFIAHANRIILKAREVTIHRTEQDKQVVQKIILLGKAPLMPVVIFIAGTLFLSFLTERDHTYWPKTMGAVMMLGGGSGGILYSLYFIFIFNLRYLAGTIDNLKTFALRCAMPGIIVGAIISIIILGIIRIPGI